MTHRKSKSTSKARILFALAFGQLSTLSMAADEPQSPTLESLQAEVDRLRGIAPGLAVAMTHIAYNFNNLWFAAQAENWPLADLYLRNTRARLRWAMRIQSEVNLASGKLALDTIANALEATQMASVADAIAARDQTQFATAYVQLMAGCEACHIASEKPFLKLQIPIAPAAPMLDFSP